MTPQQELLIRVSCETVFVVFHFSVLICVANQLLRRNAAFLTGFFKLYLAQSVVDVVAYYSVGKSDLILVFIRLQFIHMLTHDARSVQCLIAYHLPAVGMLPKSLLQGPFYGFVLMTAGYSEYAHYSLHILISANRFITLTSAGRRKVLSSS